jgi:hypothetical protein
MSATLLFASKLVETAGGAGVPWKRSAICPRSAIAVGTSNSASAATASAA